MEKNYTRQVFAGFSIIIAMTLLGAIASYLFRLVLARNLTVSEYGLFYSVYAIVYMFFVLRDFGSGSAVIKYIPEYIAKKQFANLKTGISLASLMTLVSSAVMFFLCFLFSKIIASNYVHEPNQVMFVILIGVMFFFLSFDALITNILAGFQNYTLYAVAQFLRQALPLFFISLLLLIDKNAYYAAYATILSSIVLLFVFGIFILGKIRKFKDKQSKIVDKKSIFKNILYFGIPITLVGISGMFLQFTDTILITFFLGTEKSGIYNAALPVSNILIFLSSAVVAITMPLASELWTKKLKKRLGDGLTFFYKYSVFILLPFVLVVAVFADVIISLLFTQKYVTAAPALRILIVGSFFFFIALINFSVISGIGRPKSTATITIIGAIINVVLNLILIPLFGISGAAVATSAGYFIMMVFSFNSLKKRVKLKIPILHWAKTLFLSIFLLFSIILLKRLINMNPFMEITIITSIGALLYIGAAFITKHIDFEEIKNTIITIRKKN
jgi:O-antigen/teichoic acid export membrane protein